MQNGCFCVFVFRLFYLLVQFALLLLTLGIYMYLNGMTPQNRCSLLAFLSHHLNVLVFAVTCLYSRLRERSQNLLLFVVVKPL